jgi:hypothetical protein
MARILDQAQKTAAQFAREPSGSVKCTPLHRGLCPADAGTKEKAAKDPECRVRSAIHVAASTIRPRCRQDSNVALTFHDRGTSGTQLEAVSGGLAVGSLRKDFRSTMFGGDEVWHWALYVGCHPGRKLDGFREHGAADSRATAQADLEKMWAMWLEAAGLSEHG